MKLSRIIVSLKNALGLNPVENKRKLIFNKIEEAKLEITNDIWANIARIDELIITLGQSETKDINLILDRLYSNFSQKKNNEDRLLIYEELEKYLNEDIEIEVPNTKSEAKKK